MCLSALTVAGTLCLKRVEHTHIEEELKSICPPVSGSFTPHKKVLFSVAKTKVKEALAHVIHQGILCSWAQNFHQMVSLSDISIGLLFLNYQLPNEVKMIISILHHGHRNKLLNLF